MCFGHGTTQQLQYEMLWVNQRAHAMEVPKHWGIPMEMGSGDTQTDALICFPSSLFI